MHIGLKFFFLNAEDGASNIKTAEYYDIILEVKKSNTIKILFFFCCCCCCLFVSVSTNNENKNVKSKEIIEGET